MIMFHIRVNTGDNDSTAIYYFVHKDYANLTDDEQQEAFDAAVKELNHVYHDYGRFATSVGVTRLFDKFGFERTVP